MSNENPISPESNPNSSIPWFGHLPIDVICPASFEPGNRGNLRHLLVSGQHGAEFSIAVVLQQFRFLAGEMCWRAEGDHAAAAPWHGLTFWPTLLGFHQQVEIIFGWIRINYVIYTCNIWINCVYTLLLYCLMLVVGWILKPSDLPWNLRGCWSDCWRPGWWKSCAFNGARCATKPGALTLSQEKPGFLVISPGSGSSSKMVIG